MHPRRVLFVWIVLNDSVQSEKIRTLFERKHYRTAIASDFSGAIEIRQAQEVDLIVTGLPLLLSEKERLFQSWRKNKNFSAPPILILGSENKGESIFEALKAGADDYIEDHTDDLQILERSAKLIERKQADDLLKESEEYFRSLMDNVSDVISILSFDGTIVYESASVAQVLGYRQSDLIGKIAFDFVHPDDRQRIIKYFYEFTLKHGTASAPIEYRFRDGRDNWRILESIGKVINHPTKGFMAVVNSRDVSERRKSENALRESERKFRVVLDNSLDIIYQINLKTKSFDYVSSAAKGVTGYEPEEIVRGGFDFTHSLVHADDLAIVKKSLEQAFQNIAEGIREHSIEYRLNTKHKGLRWIRENRAVLTDAANQPVAIISTARDISDQKKFEASLHLQKTLLESQTEASMDGILAVNNEGKIISHNQRFIEMWGIPEEIMNAKADDEAVNSIGKNLVNPQEFLNIVKCHYKNAREKNQTEMKLIDGRTFERYSSPIKDAQNKYFGRVWFFRDITDRKNTEDALRESEENYRDIVENSQELIYTHDLKGNILSVNKTIERALGFNRDQITQLNLDDILIPERRKELPDYLKEISTKGLARGLMYVKNQKGETRIWEYNNTLRTEGVPEPIVRGMATDMSERKQSEEVLRRTEEKLRQSQKLESVGRLAGGIAHDFNNMLTAIIGYSDLSLAKLQSGDPLRRNIEEIRKAAERSASLTLQLLAFSRQQVLQLKIVAFNEHVTETCKMLQRLIGENIALNIDLDPQVGMIEADPGQLTQVIVNLAVNSRDAMPNGGVLTVKTEKLLYDEKLPVSADSVQSRKYVLLTVQDTGNGIDPEHLSNVFEPFYTTKEIGKGTGLGLATVYGIVKQSNGEIIVESEVGSGTAFRVYFPCVEMEETAETNSSPESNPTGGTETILIVEDEAMVRELTKSILEAEGYPVITAENGAEALEICRKLNGKIDLVMTDVVMPQMSGPEFAQKIKEIFPNLPILFTSGYTEGNNFLSDLKDSNVDFIGKPFVLETLVAKVREVLDRSRK